MQAYILITAEAGRAKEAAVAINGLENVKSAHTTVGPYDIIAFVEVSDADALTNLILDKIQKIDGISRTLTCVAVS
jgi:DNA-binding Lrp family transcriptional regulator